MPLPLLGAVAAVGKGLVIGGAKAVAVGAKVGAKAAVSSGKFFAKGGANLARGGAKVARQGGKQVVKGAKFFKQKVSSVKEKGGNIANKLKQNATNLRESLKTGNKNQEKLRTKKQKRKKKTESINKKREKEKQLESKKSSSDQNKRLQSIAKSPLDILNKIFSFGGLLLGGILVNAAKGLIDKGKQFVKDNQETFDSIENFLTGVKDAAVGLFDSFTGPYAEKGGFDDFAKFDDSGKLQGGALKKVEDAYNGFGDLINSIDKALGGKGTAGNILKTDAAPPSSPSGMMSEHDFYVTQVDAQDDSDAYDRLLGAETYEEYKKKFSSPSVTPTGEVESATPINDTSSGGRRDDHSETIVRTPGTGKGVPFSASSPMQQIYLHWAGTPYNSAPSVYNSIAKGDGTLVRNHAYGKRGLAHTYGRNSKGVGLSIAAMGVKGGKWSEKRAWKEFPPTNAQLNAMTAEAARIAIAWGWKKSDINKSKILTHAEAALQDGYGPGSGDSQMRWDYHYMSPGGRPGSGGEILRNMIKKHYDLMKPTNNNLQTSATVTPTGETTSALASAINQPDPTDEGGETIFIQRVNNIQYIPIPT
jgi:hypothetical protein